MSSDLKTLDKKENIRKQSLELQVNHFGAAKVSPDSQIERKSKILSKCFGNRFHLFGDHYKIKGDWKAI